MESDSSSSSSPSPSPPRRRYDPLSARVSRALSEPLRLLHRRDSTFFVLGSTSNVYTVTLPLPPSAPSCSCPDHHRAPHSLCKHVLFVLLRVLRLPPHHPFVTPPLHITPTAPVPYLPGETEIPPLRVGIPMESDSSSSSSSPSPSPRRRRYDALSARVSRALSEPLRLLHRRDPTFFVLGSTSNVYTVTLPLPPSAPSCSCPDHDRAPHSLCKHVLFVLIRVLRVPPHRPFVTPPLHITPTAPGVLAPRRTRERFHHHFSTTITTTSSTEKKRWAGATCPVCLEEMLEGEGGKGGKVVECSTCGNGVHEGCLGRWKTARGRSGVTCVVCRARWREGNGVPAGEYVNLAGYEDDDEEEDDEG